MLPDYYEFCNPVKILSGKLALENIPHELKNLGAARPMLLTNDFLVKIGLVQQVIDAFGGSDIAIGALYDGIPPDAPIGVVNEMAGIYRAGGCDSILAVGGGSVIDAAKGLGVIITENTDDLMNLAGAEILSRRRSMPLIVVPTTAGTGSEATLVAVIADPGRHLKMEFVSYHLLPDVAVLDPRMTRSLPPKITASTGMDALSHAVEAYTCLQKNPLSDAHAFAAINLIREYLPRAVEKGGDDEARLAMANASLLAGAAFSNSMVGIVHAIGHACGGVSGVAHSDAMSILLPFGMEYNLGKIPQYYAELLLPLAVAEVYAATPGEARGAGSVAAVREMTRRLKEICGLPSRLREVGVKEEDFPAIARTAVNDGAALMNPREVGYEDVIKILQEAY